MHLRRTAGSWRRAGVLRASCRAILGHERAAMDALRKEGFSRVAAHADADARAWLLRRKHRHGDLPQSVLLGAFACDQESRGLMLLGYRDPERPAADAAVLDVPDGDLPAPRGQADHWVAMAVTRATPAACWDVAATACPCLGREARIILPAL